MSLAVNKCKTVIIAAVDSARNGKNSRAYDFGSPDLAVEVPSPSTVSHDHLPKRRVYERAGVREFWLVHPIDRIVWVYLLHEGEFGKPEVYDRGSTPASFLPGMTVDWDGLIARRPTPD